VKVLVFEYLTGGGLADAPIRSSLAREGELMLRALLRDLSELPGVQVVALRDARLPAPEVLFPGVDWIVLEPGAGFEHRFRDQLACCDAVWPIAPETGGVLERLCSEAAAAGKCLLTSAAAAVRIAASKLETVRRLGRHGVPVVPTFPLSGPVPEFPRVLKPDDGVGGEGSRIVENIDQWHSALAGISKSRYVVQPWVDGDALSLSALFVAGKARLLSCNRQEIGREGGGFALRACRVNAIPKAEVYRQLAAAVAAALPELWGYAGIDLIRSGRGLHVLEINPRLTTSYVGLREAVGVNVAALVLDLVRCGHLPEFRSESGKSVAIRLETATCQ
jgi:predicted ATP-grasp superfamily ATP-dependent carboligase